MTLATANAYAASLASTLMVAIMDLFLSNNELSGYIVSVGGFLGVGERYVVVSPSAIRVTYSENDKKWVASMNATNEELKTAPEFKYEGRWKR